MNILLVDDSQEDRFLTTKNIKNNKSFKDATIEESINLTKAIEITKEKNFDLILLDLRLPESDGIDTIRTIIDHLKNINKNIPIVVLTAMEDYRISKEAFKLGIKDFVIKGETIANDLLRSVNFATYQRNLPTRKKKLFA